MLKYRKEYIEMISDSQLIVLSGPSASGKTTIMNTLLDKEKKKKFNKLITNTTRSPRQGEVDKKDFYFRSVEEFKRMDRMSLLCVTSKIYGNWYGVDTINLGRAFKGSKPVLCVLDYKGLKDILMFVENVLSIFIMPDDFEANIERIQQRPDLNQERIDEVKHLRDKDARTLYTKFYDYVVINKTVDQSVTEILNIIQNH